MLSDGALDDPGGPDYGASEEAGRELTGSDDYVDIYEEYVAGPRRGRKGGTYGRKLEPLRIKGPPQRYVIYRE